MILGMMVRLSSLCTSVGTRCIVSAKICRLLPKLLKKMKDEGFEIDEG